MSPSTRRDTGLVGSNSTTSEYVRIASSAAPPSASTSPRACASVGASRPRSRTRRPYVSALAVLDEQLHEPHVPLRIARRHEHRLPQMGLALVRIVQIGELPVDLH